MDLIEEERRLLDDSAIVRIVKVLDRASLSILELLEYGVTQREVNHALANDIIKFDRASEKVPGEMTGGDYYFAFLSSKVKLTDPGLSLLQLIKRLDNVK